MATSHLKMRTDRTTETPGTSNMPHTMGNAQHPT